MPAIGLRITCACAGRKPMGSIRSAKSTWERRNAPSVLLCEVVNQTREHMTVDGNRHHRAGVPGLALPSCHDNKDRCLREAAGADAGAARASASFCRPTQRVMMRQGARPAAETGLVNRRSVNISGSYQRISWILGYRASRPGSDIVGARAFRSNRALAGDFT